MVNISLGELSVAYDLEGPENAPTVVLAHCFAADRGFWRPHLPALVGFRVLRFDARGHGETSRPRGPYTIDDMTDDAIAVMDRLGIEHAHYVGVSMGGMVGQHLGFGHGDRLRSLTLLNTAPRYARAQQQLWRDRAAEVLDRGTEHLHDPMMRRWFTDREVDAVGPGYQYMSAAFRRLHPETFAACALAMADLDTVDHLSRIRIPTMVIAAPGDPGIPPEMSKLLATQIPGSALQWLTPARHLASLEHVERFNSLLQRFLTEAINNGYEDHGPNAPERTSQSHYP